MDYPKSVPGVGLVNGKFVDENPVTGSPGSLIPADWGNSVTDELLSVIQAAALAPRETSREQVLAALRALFLRVDVPSSQRPRLAGPAGWAANDAEGAALEIRENGLVASTDTDAARAPRIAFHWSNVAIKTLAMTVLGHLMWGGKRIALLEDIQAATVSLGPTGRIVMPPSMGGWILQWFEGALAGADVVAYPSQSFPIAFPTACHFCGAFTRNTNDSTSSDQIFQVSYWDRLGVKLFPQWFGTGSQGQIKPLIIAIGS